MDLNSGDTAWVLASTALVLLMTPGLAFFYGGMVRGQERPQHDDDDASSAIGIVTVLWVLYGYSLAFGNDAAAPSSATFDLAGLGSAIGQLTNNGGIYRIPLLVFVVFQLMFAIITVGADQRCDRRPRQVRRLGALRRPLGHARLLPGRALGLRLR